MTNKTIKKSFKCLRKHHMNYNNKDDKKIKELENKITNNVLKLKKINSGSIGTIYKSNEKQFENFVIKKKKKKKKIDEFEDEMKKIKNLQNVGFNYSSFDLEDEHVEIMPKMKGDISEHIEENPEEYLINFLFAIYTFQKSYEKTHNDAHLKNFLFKDEIEKERNLEIFGKQIKIPEIPKKIALFDPRFVRIEKNYYYDYSRLLRKRISYTEVFERILKCKTFLLFEILILLVLLLARRRNQYFKQILALVILFNFFLILGVIISVFTFNKNLLNEDNFENKKNEFKRVNNLLNSKLNFNLNGKKLSQKVQKKYFIKL